MFFPGYLGPEQLPDCLKGCDVVVIPAGVPRKPGVCVYASWGGAGVDRARLLRAFTAVQEDLIAGPTVHMGSSQRPAAPALRDPTPLPALQATTYKHTYKSTLLLIDILKPHLECPYTEVRKELCCLRIYFLSHYEGFLVV